MEVRKIIFISFYVIYYFLFFNKLLHYVRKLMDNFDYNCYPLLEAIEQIKKVPSLFLSNPDFFKI